MATINEQFSIKGEVTIIKYDIDGNITDKRKIPNLVVDAGKEFIASRMVGATSLVMSHMGIGTTDTIATTLNTTLVAQTARVALSQSVAAKVITYVATFGAGVSTGDVKEAGIFNAASAGSMLCRTTFPVVTKAIGDSIVITWVVTVS